MTLLHRIAMICLAFEMPVPLYWLVLHARVDFWRRHVRAGYWVAVLLAWGVGDAVLYAFRASLFAGVAASPLSRVAGAALIVFDILIFITAESALGGRRLVGHAELTGRGEMTARGLYTRIRHPRYLGMMAGVLGGCLLIGTPTLWVVAASWWLLALATIRVEERELRARFGDSYADYARRVPALIPKIGP